MHEEELVMSVQLKDSSTQQLGQDPSLSQLVYAKVSQWHLPFSERRVLLVMVDTTLVMLSVLLAFFLWQQADGRFLDITRVYERWYWFPILGGGWIGLSWLNDLYDIPTANNKNSSTIRVVTVGILGFFIYVFIFFIFPTLLPRLFFVYSLAFSTATVIIWRWIYAIVLSAPSFRQRVLIIGANQRGLTIAQALSQASSINYQLLGYLDQNYGTGTNDFYSLPILGREIDLLDIVNRLNVQEVIVAIEDRLEKELFSLLIDCRANGIIVSWMPNHYEKLLRNVPIKHIDPAWALQALQDKPIFSRLSAAIKRLLDILMIFLAAPLCIVIVPLIALAIRFDSPGPIFYRQTRSGVAGKPFSIIKFRTMVTDAEKDGKAQWAKSDDPRVTRIGRFLRKARLDELPQLYNALKGEMSIVGPRPERPQFIETLEKEVSFYRTRLTVKPGITGWAQIHYDYGNSAEDALIKLQYDFYYIRHQSLGLDIYILFRTVIVLLKLRGI
jgi:exopolysaccharide biosynthesis polyprenyl glycosylphosphotransferase